MLSPINSSPISSFVTKGLEEYKHLKDFLENSGSSNCLAYPSPVLLLTVTSGAPGNLSYTSSISQLPSNLLVLTALYQ